MLSWDAQQVALLAGADLLTEPRRTGGPERVSIDSRDVGPGVLFVGLAGENVHGGDYVSQALEAGAWGVLSDTAHTRGIATDHEFSGEDGSAVIAARDPLTALQRLATAWRRELGKAGAQVIGVTGSTGKTSTKEILAALLSPQRRTAASQKNFNTEIGLPLQLLAAPAGTEVIVLEMGMRGPGQIAELAAIAEPDVGVIVSIGPVHLELLGSIEAIAAAKAELIAALPAGATAVVPADEPLLAPHLRDDLRTVTFGPGGDVVLTSETGDGVIIDAAGHTVSLGVDFSQAHLRRNLLAGVAAARAVGVTPTGSVSLQLAGRGRKLELPGDITLLDDAYNANPMSMRAALDELGVQSSAERPRRRVAVLGDMLELGPAELDFHREIGAHAADRADVLITVGTLSRVMAERFGGESHHTVDVAAATPLVRELLAPGDVVLVKASNGIGLEQLCQALVGA